MNEDAIAEPEAKKKTYPYHLFEVFGIELEYMIVDKNTLSVLPMTDKLMKAVSGEYLNELVKDPISWSNELALHVLEFKTSDPARNLKGLDKTFLKEIHEANRYLEAFNAQLLPTAMHPWMDPYKEMRLWPHEYNAIYDAFNRIFDCRGHGWANLQSTHINLPFSDDAEFARLHAAIRIVLPLIPGLAASSPLTDGQVSGYKDTRLHVYRKNSEKISNITGQIIPEAVSSQQEYDEVIFQPMYRAIAPHDPEKLLQFEWLNARGAIARFDRGSIEIRLVDVQETPKADIAIAYAVIEVVRALAEERWVKLEQLDRLHETELKVLLLESNHYAEEAYIDHPGFLQAFGWKEGPCQQKDLWHYLVDAVCDKVEMHDYTTVLDTILTHGTLATRMVRAMGESPNSLDSQRWLCQNLCKCLQEGRLFLP